MSTIETIETQYQTVKRKEQNVTVEEILKKVAAPKSFLYRNQSKNHEKPISSYVPMDAGTPKKTKKYYRLTSYEYPLFDTKNMKFSTTENVDDQGYYCIKTNYSQKTCKKQDRTRYKSLTTTEELNEMYPEEHLYEDLNYADAEKEQTDLKEIKLNYSNVKTRMVKIQELFQSFKLPFVKRGEELKRDKGLEEHKINEKDREVHIYENSDSLGELYDIPRKHYVPKDQTLPVEDYLEPVQVSKDYCDVTVRRDESLFSYIMSLFEQRLRMRREINDNQQEGSEIHPEDAHKITTALNKSLSDQLDTETQKNTTVHKIPFIRPNISNGCNVEEDIHKIRDEKKKTNMADRPLPVPVENEPYYMDIHRTEAENLLRGQPDGTFILRPSSQPNHAYTLTVSCSNEVHNVGVRRRTDGRLSLGYARRGERSFESVTSLLRHHKKRRLLLVAGGTVCGATTLNDTVQYYQIPSNKPI